MIGEIDWFGAIVGGAADGEISANIKIAKALIRAGLGVVIIEPNGKKAVCTLNEREKKAANVEAQDAARAKGSPNWERVSHDCGIWHVITDEKLLIKSRVKYWLSQGANLAVAPGTGERRIIIVDVDTTEERRAFLKDWEDAGDDNLSKDTSIKDIPLTVASPGVMDTSVGQDAVWTHKNGGHYWFIVPEDVELPERPGKLTWCRCHGTRQPVGTCRNAWSAYYASGYVLLPPSVRPEGPYRLTGAVHTVPEFLLELIRTSRSADHAEGLTGGLSALRAEDDPIDAWSAEHTWAEILTEDGFTAYDYDTCGCPTYTRPGSPVHSKSVTAHEVGCTQYDTTKGHGPLRIWSDALGSGTFSKLSYMAKYHHDGDMGKAMRALGIESLSNSDELTDFAEFGDFPKDNALQDGASNGEENDPFAPIDWQELFNSEQTVAEYLPAMMLERGQQIALIGDGKSGKSLFEAEWCIKAVNGESFLNDVVCEPLTILYLDAENSKRDLLLRMRSLNANPDNLKRLVYLSFPPFKPLDSNDGAKQVMALVQKYKPDVVILDTVSRFIAGKENDSDTWLNLYRVLHRRLKALNIAGIRLDHFGKDAEKGGRGSSAKSQDIDHVWELSVTEESENQTGEYVEVTTMLELRRTHTRTGLGPGRMRIRRRGMKTLDETEWLPGETSHRLADAFEDAGKALEIPPRRPVEIMRQICIMLSRSTEGLSLRQIQESVTGRKTAINEAIELLLEEGYIEREKAGRSNRHKLLKALESGEA